MNTPQSKDDMLSLIAQFKRSGHWAEPKWPGIVFWSLSEAEMNTPQSNDDMFSLIALVKRSGHWAEPKWPNIMSGYCTKPIWLLLSLATSSGHWAKPKWVLLFPGYVFWSLSEDEMNTPQSKDDMLSLIARFKRSGHWAEPKWTGIMTGHCAAERTIPQSNTELCSPLSWLCLLVIKRRRNEHTTEQRRYAFSYCPVQTFRSFSGADMTWYCVLVIERSRNDLVLCLVIERSRNDHS